MSGLMTTRPESMAAAICPADHSAHRSSPVMTSSSTHESTRGVPLIGQPSVATEQRHDLVGTQAGHVAAGSRVTQPPHQALPPGFGSFRTHNLQCAVEVDDFDLVASMQVVLVPQVRRDGHLALTVQHHDALPSGYPVLRLPRNTNTAGRPRPTKATVGVLASGPPR